MEKSQILLIASDWRGAMIRSGGLAQYFESLEQGLMSLGIQVRVLALVQPNEEEFIGSYQARYGCQTIPLQIEHDAKPANWFGRKCVSFLEILRCLSPGSRRILERLSLFKASTASVARIHEVLAREKPAAIIFGHLNARLYPLALSLIEKQQPYGIIAHDSEISQLPHNKRNDYVIRRSMLKGASWIAANSHHTKLLLQTWKLSADQVKVVNCPISAEVMRGSAQEPTFKTDDDLNLVTICRLARGKGIDIVIRALKILAEKGIPFRYEVGGEGRERRSLEELVDAMGLRDKIRFQGAVEGESKWRLLRQGNVFVMPSRCEPTVPWQEGFGIAFVEAAAFGIPAVGSKSGGIPDAVVDGETGILVPEESSGDLADALIFLYRNPEARRRMGVAARERARSQFSPEVIAAQFRELINVSTQKSSHPSGPKLPHI